MVVNGSTILPRDLLIFFPSASKSKSLTKTFLKGLQPLTKVEITFNSGEKKTEEISGKEYSNSIELQSGINTLIVTVYNANGLSETSKVKYTKE